MSNEYPPMITVEPATEEEAFLADWGRELFKSSASLADEVLKESIALASLLLSGALGFFEHLGVQPPWQVLVFVLLLAILLLAFSSLLPEAAELDMREPAALRAFRLRVLRRKRHALQCIGGLLAGAFAAAIAGVMLRVKP